MTLWPVGDIPGKFKITHPVDIIMASVFTLSILLILVFGAEFTCLTPLRKNIFVFMFYNSLIYNVGGMVIKNSFKKWSLGFGSKGNGSIFAAAKQERSRSGTGAIVH